MSAVAPAAPASLVSRCAFPPPGSELVCAVSGGSDSLALLALAVESGCRVTAVHVDHGLREGSRAEAAVVEKAAARLGARFESTEVKVSPGPNLEARARLARFAALPPGVATGHTADDQAETVLINLLRGAGAEGVGGMRIGPRHPILALRRWETSQLCRYLELSPVADPSNLDPSHLRNRVRHELLPLMAELSGRDPVPLLVRHAQLVADDDDLLTDLAAGVDATDAAALRRAPLPLARRAVRRWLRGSDAYPPSSAEVERVLEVASLRTRATELGGGARVTRSDGRLAIERPATAGSPGARG